MNTGTAISDAASGYTLTGPNSIDEGNIGAYTFTASNMVPNTTVYWELRNYGNSNNHVSMSTDFVTARTGNGQVQTNGNIVELGIDIEIAGDIENEGVENFKLVVWDSASNYDNTAPYSDAVVGALATKNITINDLAPTYQITGGSSLNEGTSGTYTFKATNFPAGTTVYWELRNYNSSPVDFPNDLTTPRTGSGQVQTNGGFVELEINVGVDFDMLTEGSENMRLVVWDSASNYDNTPPHNSPITGEYAQKNIAISDLAPQYGLVGTSTQAEPSTLVVDFYTQFVAAGTAYTWEVVPNGAYPVEAADFVGGVLPSGSGTISTYNSQSAVSDTFNISVLADNTTEGTEQYKIVVTVATVSVADKIVNVTDDSQTPAAQIHWLHWSSNAGYPSGASLIVEPSGGWYLNDNTTTSNFDLVWADMVANQGTSNNVDAIESYSASGGLTQSSIPNGTIGFNAIGAGNRYYIAIPQSIPGNPSSTALFQLPDSANANIVFSGRMAFSISSVAYWLYDVGLALSPDALNLNLKNA